MITLCLIHLIEVVVKNPSPSWLGLESVLLWLKITTLNNCLGIPNDDIAEILLSNNLSQVKFKSVRLFRNIFLLLKKLIWRKNPFNSARAETTGSPPTKPVSVKLRDYWNAGDPLKLRSFEVVLMVQQVLILHHNFGSPSGAMVTSLVKVVSQNCHTNFS